MLGIEYVKAWQTLPVWHSVKWCGLGHVSKQALGGKAKNCTVVMVAQGSWEAAHTTGGLRQWSTHTCRPCMAAVWANPLLVGPHQMAPLAHQQRVDAEADGHTCCDCASIPHCWSAAHAHDNFGPYSMALTATASTGKKLSLANVSLCCLTAVYPGHMCPASQSLTGSVILDSHALALTFVTLLLTDCTCAWHSSRICNTSV